ncbi:hypothetical protein GCM10025876_02290 [Demequina litorisediminis]|uniref:Uncharacterized protein n=1 Tax=Demequina litorisediminis TaxID=1849022 RepID=A0ABQ6I8F7_9MICO|nr:hypothetical protein GCM10025876_02290 [Demequina litorisediminis]
MVHKAQFGAGALFLPQPGRTFLEGRRQRGLGDGHQVAVIRHERGERGRIEVEDGGRIGARADASVITGNAVDACRIGVGEGRRLGLESLRDYGRER